MPDSESGGTCDVPPLGDREGAMPKPVTRKTLSTFITWLPSAAWGLSRWLNPWYVFQASSLPIYHYHHPSFPPASKAPSCLDTSVIFGRGGREACLVPLAPETPRQSPAYWLGWKAIATSIIRLLTPLAWLYSTWISLTKVLPLRGHSEMESHTEERWGNSRPLPIPHQLITPTTCSCGSRVSDPSHSAPSQAWEDRLVAEQKKFRLPEVWDHFEDNDPYQPAKNESDHRMMFVTLAEHVLSRAKFLGYVGGSAQDRLYTINAITEPHRTLLLKLVAGSHIPSPLRNHYESMYSAPCYSAADMARALFHHKHVFTECEWFILCVDWFRDWTGYSVSEALTKDVGNPEWENQWILDLARMDTEGDEEGMKKVQPLLRRVFRAFSYWEEGYEYACFK
ncbi:hypothetical protein TWF506_009566 [Arthrobotrys conoides]|uniref:Uncharacterized protein n=1 Tax=Arthrobotrys conoides TaxID=74498 RepID=A0AAN8NBT0_9PEZI